MFVMLLGTASLVAAPSTANADASCPYLRLCIWDGFNYNGAKEYLFECKLINIGEFGWSDRTKSFKNNQSPGTVATFFNWDGQKWVYLDRSVAPGFIPVVNFPIRTTDAIQVC
ncbi:hypothetical protein BS329_41500 [Amycolatopsis coloradensis]|uniref:Peptidase inhibitor family I36 n=2 Tax=Amycolatopsis coloradensis TaxID=76021 RepID=A0A1R0KDD0_9PSEU|nr:hypothetical protein BS329_41500 [Amycolatopsis coloradensis]